MNNEAFLSYEHKKLLELGRKHIEAERDQAEKERDLALNKYSQVKNQLEEHGIILAEEEISDSYSSCDLNCEFVD
jgi:hypothetical protein